MTIFQKVVKYLAIAFALFLIVSIVSGIIGTVGVLGGLFSESGVTEDLTAYPVSSQIKELKVNVGAADFTITASDRLSVESNLKNLKVEEEDGVLTITEKSKFGMHYHKAVLKLSIPDGYCFEKADIQTGAGRLTVDTLSADVLDLELGAGEVQIAQLNASESARIEGGTGKVTVSGGTLNNLELEMGVGQLNLTSALTGSSELDYGVGEANLTLIGAKDDYRITLKKGLGAATVDGKDMADGSVYGDGQNRIKIDGGVGAVNVSFRGK